MSTRTLNQLYPSHSASHHQCFRQRTPICNRCTPRRSSLVQVWLAIYRDPRRARVSSNSESFRVLVHPLRVARRADGHCRVRRVPLRLPSRRDDGHHHRVMGLLGPGGPPKRQDTPALHKGTPARDPPARPGPQRACLTTLALPPRQGAGSRNWGQTHGGAEGCGRSRSMIALVPLLLRVALDP